MRLCTATASSEVVEEWRGKGYGASHKNWIRFIRFIGMHRPLSQ